MLLHCCVNTIRQSPIAHAEPPLIARAFQLLDVAGSLGRVLARRHEEPSNLARILARQPGQRLNGLLRP